MIIARDFGFVPSVPCFWVSSMVLSESSMVQSQGSMVLSQSSMNSTTTIQLAPWDMYKYTTAIQQSDTWDSHVSKSQTLRMITQHHTKKQSIQICSLDFTVK